MRRLLLVTVLALTSPLAAAQEQECANDIKTVCKKSTGKDVLGCIDQQQKSFSAGCKAKLAGLKAAWPGFVAACKPELEKLCGDKKVADGTLGKCVKESESKLGGDCKGSYAKIKLGSAIPGGAKLPAGIPGLGGKKKKAP